MKINGFKVRFINAQCYEFILPNGKHLITDPYITPVNLVGFRPFSVDEIERCDYILLTHSHYDHTSDIGYLFKKFSSKVFCSSMVAVELAKYFEVAPGRIFPFDNMDTYEMPDFTLLTVRGKHFPMLNVRFDPGSFPDSFGGSGHDLLNYMGTIFSYDFCITLSNNIRIMFVSGTDEYKNIYKVADEYRPNVLFRHTAGSVSGEEWGKVIAKYNAQVAFPNHQDNIYNGKWGVSMDDFAQQIRDSLKEAGSDTVFINPTPYKWYDISLGVTEED
ncbi:MAG: MBL fold metallo-hydrolase [Firmicutes bacterium]|nr:MBL fold metallo-hydrolase [Bacillota bacterium]